MWLQHQEIYGCYDGHVVEMREKEDWAVVKYPSVVEALHN